MEVNQHSSNSDSVLLEHPYMTRRKRGSSLVNDENLILASDADSLEIDDKH